MGNVSFKRDLVAPVGEETSRILVIEDEGVLRLTFTQFLENEGHDVDTAENYDEAIAQLDRNAYDVLVTDIILGGKTGVDLLRSVRERGLDCVVIIITGEPNVDTASEAVRLGAFDYLPKPVTGRELKRVVRMALERRALTRERDTYAARMDMYRTDLETIFNSVHEGIAMVDAGLQLRQINNAAARMLGLDANDVVGKNCAALLNGPLSAVVDALRKTAEGGPAVDDFRIETVLDGGEPKVLMVSTSPLRGRAGGNGGAVLVLRDVTWLTNLERQIEGRSQYQNIVGRSQKMRDVFHLVDHVGETDSTALIVGESGTGKELVATALHNRSPRKNGPFIRVNCAALSEDILESELFGHVKGAFTGAVRDRIGRFEAAHGGTILLDEIGDVSPRLQLRLLRVLQEREFERVGDTVPIKVDVRVIASSNQDLVKKIQEGSFRQDLYYRLNVVRIELPPLRARRDDIPLLVDHLCRRYNATFKKEIRGLSAEALDVVMRYPWWGNVRELENSLERAFIVCHDPVIQPDHLPPEILEYEPGRVPPPPGAGAAPMARGSAFGRDDIEGVLTQTDWNIAKAARLLGIARNTLYQRIRQYGIQRPRG